MLKKDELSNPTSCLSKARNDEMVFVLLERDVAAGSAIRFWIEERVARGKNYMIDPQIQDARVVAEYIERTNGTVTLHCKGAWALGTACGECPKCRSTVKEAASVIREQRELIQELANQVRDRVPDPRKEPLPPQLERAVQRNVVVGCLWSLYQRGTIDFQTFLVESVVALEQQCDVFYKQLLSPPPILYSFPDDEAIDRDKLRKSFEDMKGQSITPLTRRRDDEQTP